MEYHESDTIHAGRRFWVRRCRREPGGDVVIVKEPRVGPHTEAGVVALRREHEFLLALAADAAPPRVSRVIEFSETAAGLPALVMVDAGPKNLHERLGRQPLELAYALELAVELARIVAALHRHQILHQDINPFNVVIANDALPVLVDFDAATRMLGLSAEDVPDELGGTLLYLAPEQTGRMNRGVDQRADLYAMGATLYEMLTGSPPFVLSDPVEIVHAHLARIPVAPSTINPKVPRLVSDIVLKLLSKAPEHRYQSAEALVVDLAQVYDSWRRGREIAAFELGHAEVDKVLSVPARLYGRGRELEVLKAAVSRAAEGGRELVVLKGPAGAGKSALFEKLAQSGRRQAMLSSGKVGQAQGDVPYAHWAAAVRPILREILDAPETERARWKRSILDAAGRNTQVLAELFPELVELVGEAPPVPSAGAVESENRFHRTLSALVCTLAVGFRPLVLFFDDLQWTDPASLKMLRRLLAEASCSHLLIVVAYRDDDLPGDLRVQDVVDAARAAHCPVATLTLGSLDLDALSALLADALHTPVDEVVPLARLVSRKTAGNAFFVRRFLHMIHQRGWLAYDSVERGWTWNTEKIERAKSTENVVALMRETIRSLPEATQALLRTASCFRGRVDLDLLAEVAGQDREQVAGRLWPALREGLLVGHGYTMGSVDYWFNHDQVQETVYDLLSARERQTTHLAIGRHMCERRERGRGGDLFETVDQLDRGAALIDAESERKVVAGLSAEAGARARAANAYSSALRYFRRGLEVLESTRAWDIDRALAFRLHRDAAESAYLLGEYDLGDALIAEARTHERVPFESAELANIQVIAAATRGRMNDAIRRGWEGLEAFGLELPADRERAWERELAEVRERLARLGDGGVLDAPHMEDPVQLACMELLSNLISPAYVTDPQLFALLVGRMVNLSLEHGNSVYSAFAYAALGMVIGSLERDYPTAHELGRAGAELARSFGDPVQECRALHVLGCFINHWRAPLRESAPLLRRAVSRGIEGGELQFAVYAAGTVIVARFHRGEPLDDISSELESFSALAENTKAKAGREYLLAYRQAIRSLKGNTYALNRFEDDDFDEDAHIASCEGNPLSLSLYYVLRLEVSFLARELDEAGAMAAEAERFLGAVWGIVPLADHNMFSSLVLAARGGGDAVAQIRVRQDDLRTWADHAPDNFRHKHLLVEAEVARLEGRVLEAAARYDEAIEAAREVDDHRDAAVASELAGRFWHAHGRRSIANLYLGDALDGYARWGANAKVAALEHEYPQATSELAAKWRGRDVGSEAASLDLMALHKAYEMLSSEVVLERLLDKLMTVSMEVAGATGAALLLEQDGALVTRASAPPKGGPEVPAALVERAREAGEPIAIGDPTQGRAFGLESAMRRGRPRSILALPISRQSVPIGVLYLENQLTTHAFSAARVRVLTLLASQMAISLENSLLFEGLSVEIAERKRAEESVRFLADASAKLGRSLDEVRILTRLAELPVPVVADWCVVRSVDGGEPIAQGAVAHPPAIADRALLDPPSGTAIADAMSDALDRGEAQQRQVDDGARAHVPPDTRALIAVPLVARDRSLAVLVCGAARTYHDRDKVLVQELAHRAAFALDNARLYAQSQRAVSVRDEFLSIASHELKTPLTSLRLASQGLVAGSIERERPAGDLRRMARVLDRQTSRLAKLVEDLLNVSRIHAGRLHLSLDHVALDDVVSEVLERFESQIGEQAVSVVSRAPRPVVGRWDRVRVDQVVTNLLSNALKFGAGKPIQIEMATSDGWAQCSVTDHGIGIDAGRLDAIFGRFERAVPASRYGGLGLGLYITQQIVTALGGAIRAESVPGERTTFVVELPLAGPPGAQADWMPGQGEEDEGGRSLPEGDSPSRRG